ncbi:CDP-alcohol phosphatidyltransferase family protein [Lutibacter sp.]|uniref:CDP-alcohol phosphatidyltransferase family protein n=1 Tax=Lutibacter sp. TaxID=1925666 RepID=UPI0025C0E96B|nr:CDP-alcohol phosphatidyltransferase family protein [Lutibacter sp.]MCF6168405.1 CDP-alcohol phosphatidyltransferase family protein [Lutibacter sp.]
MGFKKQLPNILTLLNLLSGTIAVYFAVKNQLEISAAFVLLGIFFDFFDGFVARLLNVQGELGKQLDSLADVVTSGVVPGIILLQLITKSLSKGSWDIMTTMTENHSVWDNFTTTFLISIIGLFFTLAAAYRLANFNIDERQTNSFIGLPTPAAALVVVSLPLILMYADNELVNNVINNTWFLIGLTILLSYLMNAEIVLFTLKFKEYSWKNNKVKFIFILFTILLSVLLKFIAIPVIILLYVLISVFGSSKQRV